VKVSALAAIALLGAAPCHARPPEPLPPALSSDDDRAFYAVGRVAARELEVFEMDARELQIFLRGFDDAIAGKDLVVDLETFGPRIDLLEKARKAADGAAARAMAGILDRAAREPNAVRAAAGFVLQTLTPGSGLSPTSADRVRVVSFGMLPGGVIFEGSALDKDPKLVSLASATECWRQALPTMKVGQKVKLTCPPAIAYGDKGRPPVVPSGAVVVFEIELVEVVKGGTTAAAEPAGDGDR
jgi:FKBP-type peptidyl-prolyl cis-trans isomerase FkpA